VSNPVWLKLVAIVTDILMLSLSAELVTRITNMMDARILLRFVTVILILCGWSVATFADTKTVSVVVPWQGQGQVFSIGIDKLLFQGYIEGVMYIESAEGAMDEAFVQCPIVQRIDVSSQRISSSGSCTIVVSTEDAVFADLACEGVKGFCIGEFKLTGGTGRFSGIKGSGKMTVRSPIHALVADLSGGSLLKVASGILQIPALTFTLP
jgi:hypothetical protein